MGPNNIQGQPEVPQQPTFSPNPTPMPTTPPVIQQSPQPPAPTNIATPPPLSSQPIGGQPAPYNPTAGGSSPIKKIAISIISLILLLIVCFVGYIVYKSMQYPEENKVSIAYIKALRDEDYEKIDKLYDPELSKTVARYIDIVERIQAIDASAGLDPSTAKEKMYEDYLREAEQDFSIPEGEPSRISAMQHNDANPKYIVSTYNVGDKKISVTLVYDKTGGSPKALLANEGEYDLIEGFESEYKKYKKELAKINKSLDVAEKYLDLYDSTQGDASLQSSTLKPENLFAR